MVVLLQTELEKSLKRLVYRKGGENNDKEAEGSWRVISDGWISLTRDDHEKRWGDFEPINAVEEAIEMLRDARISFSGYSATGDLNVDFEGPHTLQVLNLSSLFEAWNLYGPQGQHYVAMGGGKVDAFLPDAS